MHDCPYFIPQAVAIGTTFESKLILCPDQTFRSVLSWKQENIFKSLCESLFSSKPALACFFHAISDPIFSGDFFNQFDPFLFF